MKYLLIITMNPTLFETLSEEDKNGIFEAHEAFQQPLRESGELLGFAGLEDPSETRTVRVRDDGTSVTDGPYVEKEFLAGFYVVDCETQERANERVSRVIIRAHLPGVWTRLTLAGDTRRTTSTTPVAVKRQPRPAPREADAEFPTRDTGRSDPGRKAHGDRGAAADRGRRLSVSTRSRSRLRIVRAGRPPGLRLSGRGART